MNGQLKSQGKAPIEIKAVPLALEDEDILQMVSAGLLKAAVVDETLAKFWAQILPDLTVRSDMVVRKGDDVAWAVRKGSPKLLAVLNPIAEANKVGTLFGNQVLQKYMKSTKFVKSATSDAELQKFKSLMTLFQKYGKQYDLDYLLMMAQGYQESQLNQNAKSAVGAVGVMQVMPATGKALGVGDITLLEPNIHAGAKYLDEIMTRYFQDTRFSDVDRPLFAFASYNAGPARIAKMRKEARERGLDADKWFDNVELVVAQRIGLQTTTYVRNIFKYYTAYLLLTEAQAETRRARETIRPGAG
jgi:membrane-bound lytic murein transglycosylase MltF